MHLYKVLVPKSPQALRMEGGGVVSGGPFCRVGKEAAELYVFPASLSLELFGDSVIFKILSLKNFQVVGFIMPIDKII